MVCCYRCNGPLRYCCISVYIGPFPREIEKEESNNKRDKKMSKQPLPAPTGSAIGPCPAII